MIYNWRTSDRVDLVKDAIRDGMVAQPCLNKFLW